MNEVVRTDRIRPPAANDDAQSSVGEPMRRIEVSADQVFQREPPGPPLPWRERSFSAPVLMVIAISAALLYGAIALVALVWSWLR